MSRRSWLTPFVVVLAALVAACGSSTGPEEELSSVDVGALFAPPTADEIAAVENEWAARAPMATEARRESTLETAISGVAASVEAVSFVVEGNRQYGLVVTTEDEAVAAASLPVVLYAHGGDEGVSALELVLVLGQMGDAWQRYVWVAPSYRSERVDLGVGTYTSGGTASPWDRDVDDVIAILGAVTELAPRADTSRVAAVGFSRGGGVALLMAVRDPRVDLVAEVSGPTDFFGPSIRQIVEDALKGHLAELPGLADLNASVLDPLRQGLVSVAEARLELVRRSPVLFASRLPPVQIHHGTQDVTVDVGQAELLGEALAAIGRGPPEDELWIYEGGSHNPLSLEGGVERIVGFLERLRVAEAIASR